MRSLDSKQGEVGLEAFALARAFLAMPVGTNLVTKRGAGPCAPMQ